MHWTEIMQIKDPHEALRKIEEKVDKENLPIEEMVNAMEQYVVMHKITVDQMAYYPNGESVLGQ